MKGYYQNYIQIIEVIDYCIEKELITPALILIYSAIDSFSNFSNRTSRKGRMVFKNWVKKWMLVKYPLECSEIDLYAARCGLLHNQTSESELSRSTEAKQIYYYWGNADPKVLEIADQDRDKYVIIKVENLLYSFRNALADCYNKIDQDADWFDSFQKKAQKVLVNIKSY